MSARMISEPVRDLDEINHTLNAIEMQLTILLENSTHMNPIELNDRVNELYELQSNYLDMKTQAEFRRDEELAISLSLKLNLDETNDDQYQDHLSNVPSWIRHPYVHGKILKFDVARQRLLQVGFPRNERTTNLETDDVFKHVVEKYSFPSEIDLPILEALVSCVVESKTNIVSCDQSDERQFIDACLICDLDENIQKCLIYGICKKIKPYNLDDLQKMLKKSPSFIMHQFLNNIQASNRSKYPGPFYIKVKKRLLMKSEYVNLYQSICKLDYCPYSSQSDIWQTFHKLSAGELFRPIAFGFWMDAKTENLETDTGLSENDMRTIHQRVDEALDRGQKKCLLPPAKISCPQEKLISILRKRGFQYSVRQDMIYLKFNINT